MSDAYSSDFDYTSLFSLVNEACGKIKDIYRDVDDTKSLDMLLRAVKLKLKVLEEDGESYGAGYTPDNEGCVFCKPGKKKVIKMPWYKRLLYLVKGI